MQNSFLVIFYEGNLPGEYKKYIRFFDTNKVSKTAIHEIANIELSRDYIRNIRYFDNRKFRDLLLDLLPEDYALLIQQDSKIKRKIRYVLSHFHVKVDWLIDDATEAISKELRYVSRELYEKGEQYAQLLNQKLFEKYGFHHSVGGRRTAAVVASQFLNRVDGISTVYVSSSEARSLTCISEQGVTRFVLLSLAPSEFEHLKEKSSLDLEYFEKHYVVDTRKDHRVGLFQVFYSNTEMAKPPVSKESRKLQPDYYWLTVDKQLIVPLPDHPNAEPLHYRTIYASE